jgi:GAF domain-containing protein
MNMLASFRRFIVPLVFEDEEKTRVARLLNTVLLALLAGSAVITLVAGLFHAFQADSESRFTLLSGVVMMVIFAGLLFLARRGQLRLVSVTLLVLTWMLVTVWIYTVSGISSDSSALTYALIIVLAGLLLGGRAAMVATAITSLAALGAYWVESSGLLVVAERLTSLADVLFVVIPLVLTGALLQNAMNSISMAMERARTNERAQIEANRELEMLRASLEQRVADRTSELERRSVQLQAATEVSRAATLILEVEELMWLVVGLIQERFGLYHVGLLLLDETGEWVVYRAGSGEAGRELWDRGFRLKVGGNSIVGWCAANAQTRIAQDVHSDAMHVDHELVPRTRSEAALPLIARGQVLGALSVQSDRIGAFDNATVATLQTMADQVAVALDNARLYTESQQALEATSRAYGQLSRQAWLELLRSRRDWGYSFAQQAVVPVQGEWRPEMIEAMQTGQMVVRSSEPDLAGGMDFRQGLSRRGELASSGSDATIRGGSIESSRQAGTPGPALALPLQVREETIGVLGFYRDPEDGDWTPGETELLQRLVDQLGAALESAQLFQESQQRAAREQAIRQVTERMRSAVDVEAILQSTLVELAKVLGAPRAYVRLGTEAELLRSREAHPDDGHPLQARLEEEPKPVSIDQRGALGFEEDTEGV